jgi:hypothetical protein
LQQSLIANLSMDFPRPQVRLLAEGLSAAAPARRFIDLQ